MEQAHTTVNSSNSPSQLRRAFVWVTTCGTFAANTKPGGVFRYQLATVDSERCAVVGRVDLHGLEAGRVVSEIVAGLHAHRIKTAGPSRRGERGCTDEQLRGIGSAIHWRLGRFGPTQFKQQGLGHFAGLGFHSGIVAYLLPKKAGRSRADGGKKTQDPGC